MDNKTRQSNYELLRIIAMLLIVASHFAGHGGFELSADKVTVNRIWLQFIIMGGKIGVNIFVLISGYFLIKRADIKTSKVLKLLLQLIFYSVSIYVVFACLGWTTFGIKDLIKNCMPVIYRKWWFASAYFILYLLVPYINKLLVSLEQKAYIKLLIILTVCWCFIPTVFNMTYMSNELLWFIYVYAVAGYVRLYGASNAGARKYIISALLVALILLGIFILFARLGVDMPYFAARIQLLYGMQKVHIFAISLLLFLGFANLNIGYNRVINTIASATFGVYLIHDSDYVRPVLWNVVFKNATFEFSPFLIAYTLGVVVIVFVVATIIELVRMYAVEKRYMGAVEKVAVFLDEKFEKLVEKFM